MAALLKKAPAMLAQARELATPKLTTFWRYARVELAPPPSLPALLALVRDTLLYHLVLTPLALCWLVLGRLDKLDRVRHAMAALDTPYHSREAESVARDIMDEVLDKAMAEIHIHENEVGCEDSKEVDDNVKIGNQLENESGYLSERDVEE